MRVLGVAAISLVLFSCSTNESTDDTSGQGGSSGASGSDAGGGTGGGGGTSGAASGGTGGSTCGPCGAPAKCEGSECVCPAENQCGSSCVDKQTSTDHCGTCNKKCNLDSSCVAGACVCDNPTESFCGVSCANLANDDLNCGACNVECTSSHCHASKCHDPELIAIEQDHAYGIALAGSEVVWTTNLGGTVAKAPITGGTVTPLATGLDEPRGVATDGTDVFFSVAMGVMKVPLAGGTVTPLAPTVEPFGIGLDATHVYFTSSSGVLKVPKEGGTATTVATGSGTARELALDATHVYWTNFGDSVYRAPIGGGTAVALATNQKNPWGIALDGSLVYWTNYENNGLLNGTEGSIASVDKSGGVVTVVQSKQNHPLGIVVSGSVYWTAGNRIHVTVPGSGDSGPIIVDSHLPQQIVADATHIYWTTDTSVWRALK